jgi:hypothetical protein
MRVRLLAIAGLVVLAPLIIRAQAGPDCTSQRCVYLPSVAEQLPSIIRNADFELGDTGDWQESSSDGRALITATLPIVGAHGGMWVARLGGRLNEVTTISQTLTLPIVPEGHDLGLSYWYYYESPDTCRSDPVDEADVVFTPLSAPDQPHGQAYGMCLSTPAWTHALFYITDLAGQAVSLEIQTDSIGAVAGTFYIDDLVLFETCPDPSCPPPPTPYARRT